MIISSQGSSLLEIHLKTTTTKILTLCNTYVINDKIYNNNYIYNIYCLPMGIYGIGIDFLSKGVIKKLNIIQNNTIRCSLGLHKYCHISKIKHIMCIQDIEFIYYKFKLILMNILLRHLTT
jgi:hypothetical protein